MTGPYDDIIAHSHHESLRHPRMPRIDRAAQFAPFAALTGYDSAIEETARLTEQKSVLSDEAKAEINTRLSQLLSSQNAEEASVTYFSHDQRKEGGSYKNCRSTILSVSSKAELVLGNGLRIPIEDIISIE